MRNNWLHEPSVRRACPCSTALVVEQRFGWIPWWISINSAARRRRHGASTGIGAGCPSPTCIDSAAIALRGVRLWAMNVNVTLQPEATRSQAGLAV
jgi:hypothetical protein